MEKTNTKPCQTALENKYETVSRRWKTNTKLYFLFLLIFRKCTVVQKCINRWKKTNTNPYQTVRETNTKLYFLFTGAFKGIFGKKTLIQRHQKTTRRSRKTAKKNTEVIGIFLFFYCASLLE